MDEFTHYFIRQQAIDDSRNSRISRRAQHHLPTGPAPLPARRRAAGRLRRLADALEGNA